MIFLFIVDDASILKLLKKKYPYFYISGFYPKVKVSLRNNKFTFINIYKQHQTLRKSILYVHHIISANQVYLAKRLTLLQIKNLMYF